jgi:phosphoribosylglycinamide formyltransferase-1
MSNLAVFASGRGSNFQNLYHRIVEGKIKAQIGCLITDNPAAGAIGFAEKNRINVFIIPPKDFSSPEEFGRELLKILSRNKIEWIILAGYLKKIPDNVVLEYSNRIINIHPALLPAFGGKGMYGIHVHREVLASGAKISGVTVHLVNNEYDKGPIVMQQAVDIENCQTPEEIAATVLKIEHQLYYKAVQKLLASPHKIVGNRVVFE